MTKILLGQTMRDAREAQQRSIESVAHTAGIHPTSLSRIERGLINPSWEKVAAIAHGLHLHPSELVRQAEVRAQEATGGS